MRLPRGAALVAAMAVGVVRASVAPAGAALGCSASAVDAEPTDASCGGCHADIAARFATSAHARASDSPVFVALRARATPEQQTFCDRCHAPHQAEGERGVGCVTCHRAVGNEDTQNGLLIDGASDTMGGPYADADPGAAHRAAARPFVSASELCGTCHEVSGPGAFHETPFSEWSASPAKATGTTCAGCHMSTVPGNPSAPPLREALVPGGKAREVRDHAFAGPEDGLLAGAATVTVTVADHAADHEDVSVHVVSRLLGHALPTGARFLRDVHVSVTATDELGGEHALEPESLSDAMTDAKGAPTFDPLAAASQTVRAIPAGGTLDFTRQVPAAFGGARVVSVTARLVWRRYDPAVLAALGLDTSLGEEVPVSEGRADL